MVFKSVVVCMEISRVHLCFQVGDFAVLGSGSQRI
jgi:hypothetical protein